MVVWSDLFANVLANVVFWFGLGLFVLAMSRRTQQRFRQFFGLTAGGTLCLYLSNINDDLSDSDPRIVIVHGVEMRAIHSVSELLARSSIRSPEIVRGLVDGIFLPRKTSMVVDISPSDPAAASVESMLVVGSASRNAVRRRFVKTHQSLMATSLELLPLDKHPEPLFENSFVEITRGPRAKERLAHGRNFAIVERHVDASGRCAIYCVGARGDSSWLAVEWVVRHWRELAPKYGDRHFAICLAFPHANPGDRYLYAYVEPVELAEVY